jgi:glutamate transport system substrate-binding protein
MSDDLDRWLRTHNEALNARVNGMIDVEARRRRVSTRALGTKATARRGLLVAAGVIVLVSGLLAGSAQLGGSRAPEVLTPMSWVFPAEVTVGVGARPPGVGHLYGQSGFEYQLVDWLAAELGFTAPTVELDPGERETALRDGRVQLVIDAYSITDARRREVSFAGPYLMSQQGIMVRADDTRIRTVGDLSGKTVCTLTASTTSSLGQLAEPVSKIEQPDVRSCLTALVTRQVDAVAADQLVLYGFAQADKDNALRVVPDLVFGQQEQYGIGLPHDNKAWCTALSDALRRFIDSGDWDSYFRDKLPGVSPVAHKPDPNRLNPC